MGQLLKLWWMAFWRLFIMLGLIGNAGFISILITAFIPAFVLRVIFGYTLDTWPMIKLFKKNNPLRSLRWRKKYRKPQSGLPNSGVSTIGQDYRPGSITGYEPRSLEHVNISNSSLMYGNPGAGLSSSGFSAENIELGQKGEINFAKSLTVAQNQTGYPIIDMTNTFWSVAMPSKNFLTKDREFDTDIDCIVLSDDTIYLIDLKYYKSGNISYRAVADELICTDLSTRKILGPPKKMSRNMAMAQDRFSKHFPQMQIKSRVVFMPTDKGSSQLNGVYWPGNIPAVGLLSMLDELSKINSSTTSKRAQEASKRIAQLLK